jgi:hypothetical protein
MSSNKLGSSGKVLEIDLLTTAPPFTFAEAFIVAYPTTGVRSFVSRAIVSLDGPGTLVYTDGEGDSVTLTLLDHEVNEVEAVGVVSNSGVTKIRVLL